MKTPRYSATATGQATAATYRLPPPPIFAYREGRYLRNKLITQLARFAAVGTVGLVIDVTVFNVLRMTVLRPEDLAEGPVVAKIVSTSLAIVANWLGNRYWTFHREQRAHPVGEGLRFAIVSITAMAIPLGCLWVSHYVLGMTSLLADNASTNVIGLGLGMVFRFWLYRVWVFAEPETGVAGLETAALEGGTSTSVYLPRAEGAGAERPRMGRSRSETTSSPSAIDSKPDHDGSDPLQPERSTTSV